MASFVCLSPYIHCKYNTILWLESSFYFLVDLTEKVHKDFVLFCRYTDPNEIESNIFIFFFSFLYNEDETYEIMFILDVIVPYNLTFFFLLTKWHCSWYKTDKERVMFVISIFLKSHKMRQKMMKKNDDVEPHEKLCGLFILQNMLHLWIFRI